MVYGIIAAVFLLFFAVSAAGGYYMYRYAVVRRKNATDYWAHPEKVKPPQDMTAERAEIVVRGRKFLLENGGKPYYRVSRDGLTLACRILHPDGIWTEQPRGIFLCCHGYRSHAIFDFSGAAEWLLREGFSLCLIDKRACGSSAGKYITFGIREWRTIFPSSCSCSAARRFWAWFWDWPTIFSARCGGGLRGC